MFKISVIMPAFNCERFIERAIDSVLSQNFKNIELIIIDDASTDKTLNICEKYKDKRIKLLKNNINQGVSFSRNKGLENATGDYIFFLDADDYIVNTLFEDIINIKNFEFYDFIIIGKTFDNKNCLTKACLPLKEGEYNLCELVRNDIDSFLDVSIGVWITNKLYKKKVINSVRFDTSLSNGEDVKFGCEVLKNGNSFYLLENYGTIYNRENENALSKVGVKNILNTYILQIGCHEQVVKHFHGKCNNKFYSNYMRFASYCFQKLLNCISISKNEIIKEIERCTKIYNFSREFKYAKNDFEKKLKRSFLEKNYKLLLES